MYNEVIYLLSVTRTTNDIGDTIETPKSEMRFAKIKSIGQSEFYQAQAQGLKPEIKFELADYLDYNNQEEVVYNGFRYKVLRTFRAGNKLELVCYGGIRLEVFENGNS
jgi:SPP1 family predicted phage head-tail adaptor